MALLDRTHTPRSARLADARLKDEWCAEDVARVCGASYFSTLHLLERQKKYGILDRDDVDEVVLFTTKAGQKAEIPLNVKTWTITPKGRERLARRGGHAVWCPLCAPRS